MNPHTNPQQQVPWTSLSPEQQAQVWHDYHMSQAPQPTPPRPSTNVAAIISLSSAILSLLVLPILFGPVALIAGFVGEHQSRTQNFNGQKVALAGIIIGIITTGIVFFALASV